MKNECKTCQPLIALISGFQRPLRDHECPTAAPEPPHLLLALPYDFHHHSFPPVLCLLRNQKRDHCHTPNLKDF